MPYPLISNVFDLIIDIELVFGLQHAVKLPPQSIQNLNG